MDWSTSLKRKHASMVTKDSTEKTFQLKFVRAAQMRLFANVVCDPPLGSTTVVPFGETVLFVPLREPTSFN